MQAEPLIHWSEPVMEIVGFVAQFVAVGAVGFRYAAIRDRLGLARAGAADGVDAGHEQGIYADAASRAATIGVVGALVQLLLFLKGLPGAAARAHVTSAHLLTHDLPTGAQGLLLLAAVVGLGAAAARKQWGWPLALAGVIAAPLTGVFLGKWARLVNPLHRIMGGLWIGTLFILVVAGIAMVLRDERSRERRGAIVADMVNGFSPLALSAGMVLVLSGLITAWRHLNPLSSLWSTPYGYALIAKLVVVSLVFSLGAWNWRRQRPALGSEDAAIGIRRSATRELLAAGVVLVITAVLVSLPSPKPPKPPAAQTPGATQTIPG